MALTKRKTTVVSDPEGNKIKTKTNNRTGITKTVVKYADSNSSGAKREVTRTQGLTKKEAKVKSMYDNNPTWASEDGYKPKMKTGGIVNSNAKITAAKSASTKGTKVGVNTAVSAAKSATGKSVGKVNTPVAKPKMKKGGMMKGKSC